ncbi:MAG: addiction module protein [Myxococcales bacterium]|nr:addiction module protein [Myxococcales bacterium]
MSPLAKLRQQALLLSEQERVELAADLLDSVTPTASESWQVAWAALAQQRLADHRASGTEASTWEDVSARLRTTMHK